MAPQDDAALIAALRDGDGAAFAALIERYHAGLQRVARTFVSSDATAQEVVQDTWEAVLNGIAGFEQRSSFKTWLFRILVNQAKTKGVREARMVPASALGDGESGLATEAAVDPSRFTDRGKWSQPPARWADDTPEKLLLRHELSTHLVNAIGQLPERQGTIVVLRDALGWSAEEVCNVLDINETNQRVLLHRARARLRTILESYQGNDVC